MGQLRRYFPADLLQLSPPTHENNHCHAFTLLLSMKMKLITNKNTIIKTDAGPIPADSEEANGRSEDFLGPVWYRNVYCPRISVVIVDHHRDCAGDIIDNGDGDDIGDGGHEEKECE